MRRVYISGPMTGLTESEYRKLFNNAADFYEACGCEVVNPVNVADELRGSFLKRGMGEPEYRDYMKADLEALAGCNTIAMLDGWRESSGAMTELSAAHDLGFDVVYFRQKQFFKKEVFPESRCATCAFS